MNYSIGLILLLSCCSLTVAEDAVVSFTVEAVTQAVQKSIPLLEQGAEESANERTCFTCHNQGLTTFALNEAALRGFQIDREKFQRQIQHTWDHLNRGKARYQDGKGQGGQVLTAGYAMWTIEAGGWEADEVTTAVTHYLTEYQQGKGYWNSGGNRPPSSGSNFTASYLALRAMDYYGSDEQQSAIQTRREAASKEILKVKPLDTEDRVFRLQTLPYIEAGNVEIQTAVEELLSLQNQNGGWSQNDKLQPDAYATATVLWSLQEAGGLPNDHPAIVAGCKYLLGTQLEDGSWHVVTRAKPIQDYYESGFPHDEDQFISISATSWATLVLARRLPAKP
ncbi:hypothetical protein OAF42_02065 [Planctomicrobium sp.]|nr:prenyltransferase/squalene oxidase repeat-containing protein [Planctomicrobium sp.]MDB4733208.1 hypothetical protein [Planctomicrobium sp.]